MIAIIDSDFSGDNNDSDGNNMVKMGLMLIIIVIFKVIYLR